MNHLALIISIGSVTHVIVCLFVQATSAGKAIDASCYVETSSKNSSKSVKDAFEIAVILASTKTQKTSSSSSMQRQRSFKVRFKGKSQLKSGIRDKAKSWNCMVMWNGTLQRGRSCIVHVKIEKSKNKTKKQSLSYSPVSCLLFPQLSFPYHHPLDLRPWDTSHIHHVYTELFFVLSSFSCHICIYNDNLHCIIMFLAVDFHPVNCWTF